MCVLVRHVNRTCALTYSHTAVESLQEIGELCQHLTEAHKNYQDQKSNRTLSILTVDVHVHVYVENVPT